MQNIYECALPQFTSSLDTPTRISYMFAIHMQKIYIICLHFLMCIAFYVRYIHTKNAHFLFTFALDTPPILRQLSVEFRKRYDIFVNMQSSKNIKKTCPYLELIWDSTNVRELVLSYNCRKCAAMIVFHKAGWCINIDWLMHHWVYEAFCNDMMIYYRYSI